MSIIADGIIKDEFNDGHGWSFDGSGVLTVTGIGGDLSFLNKEPWDAYTGRIEKIIYQGDMDYIFGNMTSYPNLKEVDYDCRVKAVCQRYGHEIQDGGTVCSPVEKVIFGPDVHSVGPEAFAFCSKLTDIQTPETGAVLFGHSVFADCIGLKKVKLNNGVARIGNFMFAGCISLESASLPDSIDNLYRDSGVFYRCDSLKDLEISRHCDVIWTAPFPLNITGSVNAPLSLKDVPNDSDKEKITYSYPKGCHVTRRDEEKERISDKIRGGSGMNKPVKSAKASERESVPEH